MFSYPEEACVRRFEFKNMTISGLAIALGLGRN